MWADSYIAFTHPVPAGFPMERVMGIEPTSSAWKAEVLPLNYTRLVLRSAFALVPFIRHAKILTVFFKTV